MRHRRARNGRRLRRAGGDTGGLDGFRKTEIENLYNAIGSNFHIRGLQIAMDDALLMRGFERLGNLLGDGQRLVDGNGSSRDALGEIVTLDEFHDERSHAAGFFQAMDCAMFGWFSDASVWASRVNRANRSGSFANESGRILSATSRFSFVSRAR